ncbi:YaaA family protein [Paramicrobacterium sp. CJ85]|uniref:YaaA family protein n=1 Tax=Paramicrobacterium sp. CJ85 TaxID=3445355 RepID=UPI003F5EB88F
MLVLLPPSETKRTGGTGRSLSSAGLSFRSLSATRDRVIQSLIELSRDEDASVKALKLGPKQRGEVAINRMLEGSPTMPAIDRYTGVLFDALDAGSLTDNQRDFAHKHVVIHSALFGLLRALDEIPAYRLSHGSRVPGVSMKKTWKPVISAELREHDGLILDLRSEGYADLGPAPDRIGSHYVRVLSAGEDGRRRALNHFNKKAKGTFTRSLIQADVEFADVPELISWASGAGYSMEMLENGEIALIV